VIPIKRTAGGL